MYRPAHEPLSARQAEIAALVARGKSNREIADTLRLSPRTVDAHIIAIFNKVGVRSRVELTVALLRPNDWHSAPEAASPLHSVDAIPNNLPRKLSSFIGREQEIAAIRALLEMRQLVTLVGSAGVGKTSTSLRVAETMLADFKDGAWFVELAPLTNGDYIPATTARALNLRLSVDGDPLESLVRQLKTRRALLIFDNCEHLIESSAVTIAAILQTCKEVKIVASSRQPLRVTGESAFRIPSLAFPKAAKAGEPKASEIVDYEAVRLFVDRASSVDNRFALSDDNAPSVGEICRRLDGIPLAIELAAARIALLTPQHLRDKLDERFRILTGGSRDAVPRHQTLRTLIDWSHDLLDFRERAIFRRLGIFVDGFTLEGAIAVRSETCDEDEVFDVLGSLVEKSLVLAESAGDTMRFQLLESTRAYALERLESANEGSKVGSLHLRYLRNRFVELWAEARRTGLISVVGTAFAIELGNLRSALDRASLGPDLLLAAELLTCVPYMLWLRSGLNSEAIERYRRMSLILPDNESRLIAYVSRTLLNLLDEGGKPDQACDVAVDAVKRAAGSGDSEALAYALSGYARTMIAIGRFDDAEKAFAEADRVACDPIEAFYKKRMRANIKYQRGDSESAIRAGKMILEECRSRCEAPMVRLAEYNLARFEYMRDNVKRAIELARVVVRDCREAGDEWLLPFSLRILAASLASCDDRVGAAAAAEDAIRLTAAVEPDGARTGSALAIRAYVFALGGKLALAAVLEGYASVAFRRVGYRLEPYESLINSRLLATLQTGLEPDDLNRHRALGATLGGDAAVALALGK